MNETMIDHEVRIRILEKTATDIHKLLIWILVTVVTTGVPVVLHSLSIV